MMFEIPRWFYKLRYEIVNGNLVKIIKPTFIGESI
ncbi:hypothetical protein LCGC14_1301800 [marine sediment metagenome]|uniref:Uncharacterized protein n=1 Tax=marine sediment metagenome TaxID=412755 RepID=A0A0F9N5Y5_9ZZZZ